MGRALVVLVAVLGLLGCTPGPAAEVAGVTWRLVELRGQPADPAATVTAIFEDGRVGGSAGCNHYGGPARLRGNRVSVGPIASTLMACTPDSIMDQEAVYLQALEAADRWQLAGDRLVLHDSAGGELVAYVRTAG